MCFTELSFIYTKRNLLQCFSLWEMMNLFNRLAIICSKMIIRIPLYLITIYHEPQSIYHHLHPLIQPCWSLTKRLL